MKERAIKRHLIVFDRRHKHSASLVQIEAEGEPLAGQSRILKILLQNALSRVENGDGMFCH